MGDAVLPVLCGRVGKQVGDDLSVAGPVEPEPLLLHVLPQFEGVDDVAVVAERQLQARTASYDRLRVDDAIGAGGGVAGVGDRYMAR